MNGIIFNKVIIKNKFSQFKVFAINGNQEWNGLSPNFKNVIK